jgi:hypothetical protein
MGSEVTDSLGAPKEWTGTFLAAQLSLAIGLPPPSSNNFNAGWQVQGPRKGEREAQGLARPLGRSYWSERVHPPPPHDWLVRGLQLRTFFEAASHKRSADALELQEEALH